MKDGINLWPVRLTNQRFIFTRSHDKITNGNDIVSRGNDITTRKNDITTFFVDIITRGNGIITLILTWEQHSISPERHVDS